MVNLYHQVIFKYQANSNYLKKSQAQVKLLSISLKLRQVIIYQVELILSNVK